MLPGAVTAAEKANVIKFASSLGNNPEIWNFEKRFWYSSNLLLKTRSLQSIALNPQFFVDSVLVLTDFDTSYF